MAFKFPWWDRINNRDTVLAEDVNELAAGIRSVGQYAEGVVPPAATPQEAEAGIAAEARIWSPQRIKQAILAHALTNAGGEITGDLGVSGDITTHGELVFASLAQREGTLPPGVLYHDGTSLVVSRSGNMRASLWDSGSMPSVTQAEAQSGSSHGARAWTPQRIKQAIDALGVPNTRTVNGKPLSGDVVLTAGDVGLGNADNTSDVNKPVSTAQSAAISGVQADLNTHKAHTANPHAVTKAQVGLGDVQNLTPADMPVSTAQQTALDSKASTASLASHVDDYSAHKAHTANPHAVTKAQVGLGDVQNLTPADMPVSTAQQTALDSKASTASLASHVDDYSAHKAHTANPHAVTKAQVGLGDVQNLTPADMPVSTAQQTALDSKASTASLASHVDDYSAHKAHTANPHAVTKAQVGLGDVQNLTPADMPVSTAQQTALDSKASTASLASHVDDYSAHVDFTDRGRWDAKLSTINFAQPVGGDIELRGGTGITISSGGNHVTIAATGDAAPGAHASSHAAGGSDAVTPASIGAATASHTHDASNITSGLLPIARGGTGSSTAANARSALGVTPANIGAATASHAHDASNITSGLLPIARGGTGSSTAANARSALGVTPANIGAATTTRFTATVSASWGGTGPYTQNITISGLLSTDTPIVGPVLSSTLSIRQAQQEAWNMVSRITTSTNILALTCDEEKPATEVPIQVVVVR